MVRINRIMETIINPDLNKVGVFAILVKEAKEAQMAKSPLRHNCV